MDLYVVERHRWWTPQLKNSLRETGIRVRQSARLSHLHFSPEAPRPVGVIVDLQPELYDEWELLVSLWQQKPMPAMMLLVPELEMDCEWLFRELGVIDVAAKPLNGYELSNWVRGLQLEIS